MKRFFIIIIFTLAQIAESYAMIDDKIAKDIGLVPQKDSVLGARKFLPQRKPKKEISFDKAFSAAFDLENTLGAMFKFLKLENTPIGAITGDSTKDIDPDFNPFDKNKYSLKGYEEYVRFFTHTQNRKEADEIKKIIDTQKMMRSILRHQRE